MNRHIQQANGKILTVVEREWTADSSISVKRDRSTATVRTHLSNGDDAETITLTAKWHREPPYPGDKISRVWRHVDDRGGRWSVEYGYDGRYWCLFGPDGTPWGALLDRTIAGSLIQATEYGALRYAKAWDFDRAIRVAGGPR